jgi:mannose-6-phosphate isomerase
MSIIQLVTKRVEKPWGRHDLWPGFLDAPAGSDPIGEVWFEEPSGAQPELLIKYLFTSQKLSVQVHPNDAEAKAHGYPRGKDEAWLILSAEPHATIALGTLAPMSKDELRASALDGSIETKLDWKPVKADDTYYSPAGTVHAIGPGLVLIEVQQNVDLTYRLYDYGSDRELHLDNAVAVSNPVPYVASYVPHEVSPGREILGDGPAFVLERWRRSGSGTLKIDGRGPLWLVPVTGGGTVDGEAFSAGGVWMVDDDAELTLNDGADMLVAYAREGVIDGIWG